VADAGPGDAGADDAGPADGGAVDAGDQDAGPAGCDIDCSASNWTCCDTSCRDLQTDSANCGACGTVCPNLQYCVDGSCVNAPCYDFKACDPGLWCCGGACCAQNAVCCAVTNGGFQCTAPADGCPLPE
jgi:hypothetical protein